MKNKKSAIFSVLGLVLILIIAWLFSVLNIKEQEVSLNDPIYVALEFYEPWLGALQEVDTDPFSSGLAKDPILSRDLSKRLIKSKKDMVDPVLCQEEIPTSISARYIYEIDDKAQILVLSRDEQMTGQSVATLIKQNDGWYIDNIECFLGEFAPEREFSFDREGVLLNVSELSTYESDGLYFVFEENGKAESIVPLFFSQESECSDLNGDQSICEPGSFKEKTKAIVSGEMTESGLNVKQIKFIEDASSN